jgi:hypothetical protein
VWYQLGTVWSDFDRQEAETAAVTQNWNKNKSSGDTGTRRKLRKTQKTPIKHPKKTGLGL